MVKTYDKCSDFILRCKNYIKVVHQLLYMHLDRFVFYIVSEANLNHGIEDRFGYLTLISLTEQQGISMFKIAIKV